MSSNVFRNICKEGASETVSISENKETDTLLERNTIASLVNQLDTI